MCPLRDIKRTHHAIEGPDPVPVVDRFLVAPRSHCTIARFLERVTEPRSLPVEHLDGGAGAIAVSRYITKARFGTGSSPAMPTLAGRSTREIAGAQSKPETVGKRGGYAAGRPLTGDGSEQNATGKPSAGDTDGRVGVFGAEMQVVRVTDQSVVPVVRRPVPVEQATLHQPGIEVGNEGDVIDPGHGGCGIERPGITRCVEVAANPGTQAPRTADVGNPASIVAE